MAKPPHLDTLRHRLLSLDGTVHRGLGFAIRASSRQDDPGSCNKHPFPYVGLDLGMEYNRCCGCESASIDWKVRICSRVPSPPSYSLFSANKQPFVIFLRSPIIQSNAKNTTVFVYLTLLISAYAYVRFCTLVINDITNYLGIACFTVRKKDADGVWRDVKTQASGAVNGGPSQDNNKTVKEIQQNKKMKMN